MYIMNEALLVPVLKHKIISHFFSYNFKSGNQNISEYLQNLGNIIYNDNCEIKNKLEQIKLRINQLSTMINPLSNISKDDLYPVIEDELNIVLSNISDISLLKNILYFFEPNLN